MINAWSLLYDEIYGDDEMSPCKTDHIDDDLVITTVGSGNTASADTGGSNDSSFDLHLVPNGQAKGNADPNANQILNDLVVAGADTFTFDTEKIVLEGGDRIIAVSQSPANLAATISYLEV